MSATTAVVTNLQASDLPSLAQHMIAAACIGITWYLCAELNFRLLLRCTRRSLYFWACLLCTWAITIHTLFILLENLSIWKNYGATVIIETTWWAFVVTQSIVLYSRLDLVLRDRLLGCCVLWMIMFTATVVGAPTAVFALVARYPGNSDRLTTAALVIDKVQLATFCIQETLIGLLYIHATASYLKNRTFLGGDPTLTRRVLHHLIYVNAFIICLDCSLIGLYCAGNGYFFLQGFYKAAIYAIKLRTEFTILEQLRSTLPGGSSYGSGYAGAQHDAENLRAYGVKHRASMNPSQDSGVGMISRTKEAVVTTTTQDNGEKSLMG